MQQIAKVIALPGTNRPVRFPSFPALERTATMAFNASIPMTVPSAGAKVMLTRDARYPLWGSTQVANPSQNGGVSYAVSYVCSSHRAPVATSNELWSCAVLDLCGVRNQDGSFTGSLCTNDTGPSQTFPGFLDALIARDIGDVPWIYVPAGAHVGVSLNGNAWTTGYSATVDLEVWTAPGEAQYYTAVSLTGAAGVSAAAAVFTPPAARWLRPTNVAFATAGGTAASTPIVAVDVFCTASPPTYTAAAGIGSWAGPNAANSAYYFMPMSASIEWNNSRLPWSATRTNAVAALFTNTTKVLNKEGTVLWGRVNPAIVNPWDALLSNVETLHPSEKKYLPLETGCYAYNPPSTDLAYFTSYVQRAGISGVSQEVPTYRLDNNAFVELGFFSDPDGGTSLAVNLDYHIEFRTNSTLFNIGVSSSSLEALHMAQVHLMKAGFFFKNDDHVSYLTSFINNLAKLHPFLSVMSPIAGGLLKATSVAMSRSTKGSRPPPTSGTRSGIVPTRTRQRRPRRNGRNQQGGTQAKGYATPLQRLDALDRAMQNQSRPSRVRNGQQLPTSFRLPSRVR